MQVFARWERGEENPAAGRGGACEVAKFSAAGELGLPCHMTAVTANRYVLVAFGALCLQTTRAVWLLHGYKMLISGCWASTGWLQAAPANTSNCSGRPRAMRLRWRSLNRPGDILDVKKTPIVLTKCLAARDQKDDLYAEAEGSSDDSGISKILLTRKPDDPPISVTLASSEQQRLPRSPERRQAARVSR